MAHPKPRTPETGAKSSHFHLPMQFFLGLLFLAAGALFFLKKIGRDYIPFIPENILIYICAAGSLLGGVHLIISKIWKPRVYIQ